MPRRWCKRRISLRRCARTRASVRTAARRGGAARGKRKRTRDRDALLPPPEAAPDICARTPASPRRRSSSTRVASGPGNAAAHGRIHIGSDTEIGEGGVRLKHDAGVARRRQVGNPVRLVVPTSGCRAGDRTEQRCLTAPRQAEEADEFPGKIRGNILQAANARNACSAFRYAGRARPLPCRCHPSCWRTPPAPRNRRGAERVAVNVRRRTRSYFGADLAS